MCLFLAFVAVMVFQSSGAMDGALACPSETTRHSHTYSSGGTREWCARADGVKHGPARAYYSNGQLLSSGEYVDGAAHAAAVYYFNDGTVWRRDVWNEGALVSKWLSPAMTTPSREQLARLGAVGGGNDVGASICGPEDRRPECGPTPSSPVHVLKYQNGRRRARGSASDGLRTDGWTFW